MCRWGAGHGAECNSWLQRGAVGLDGYWGNAPQVAAASSAHLSLQPCRLGSSAVVQRQILHAALGSCRSAHDPSPPSLPPRSPASSALQRQILDKLREHERGIDAEVEEIISERRRCRDVMVRRPPPGHRGWPRRAGAGAAQGGAVPAAAGAGAGPACWAAPAARLRVPITKLRRHNCFTPAPAPALALQEEAYQRMSALKKAQWERNNTFYSNRAFSRDVRKVGAGARKCTPACACMCVLVR